MNRSWWFWGGLLAYTAVCLGAGFWLVPEWAATIQSDQQRYQYLTESIWCPI